MIRIKIPITGGCTSRAIRYEWIFSFQTHNRGTKWTRQFRNTNFIRRRQRMPKPVEVTPPELKGTSFGLFSVASGLCMLLAV